MKAMETFTSVNKNATIVLSEINRGLSSPDIGTQIYTIARIPAQVEAYPYPVVLDSVFGHVADVYGKGPNYLRVNILRVVRECSKHLSKLSRVSTYSNMIGQTMCQTDPTTRALTLRMAGCLHHVLKDETTVHNCIFSALDSKYPVEVDAALWASERYASRSENFCESLRSKAIEMLESLRTETEVKLKLVTIAQHFHHSSEALEQTRNCFLGLLPENQSTEFLTGILHTLTLLAVRARIHASEQVDLVMNHLSAESHRPFVQACLLRDARLLVQRVPHLWMPSHIEALCSIALSSKTTSPASSLSSSCLRIVRDLVVLGSAASSITSVLKKGDANPLLELTRIAAYNREPCLQCYGLQLMVSLELEGLASSLEDEVELVITTLFADDCFFVRTPPVYVKGIYHCIIERFRRTGRIPQSDIVKPLLRMKEAVPLQLHCDFLCALYACWRGPVRISLDPVLPLLASGATRTGLSLCLLLMTTGSLSDATMAAILQFVHTQDAWTVYKIARAAARFGLHSMAGHLFAGLVSAAVSDRFIGWLKALRELSWAQQCLTPSSAGPSSTTSAAGDAAETEPEGGGLTLQTIARAMSHLVSANSCLPNSDGQLWFPKGYLQARLQWVKAVYELTWAALHFPERQDDRSDATGPSRRADGRECEQPPRLGSDELKHCVTLFKECQISLRNLQGRCLDAENSTHNHLQLLCYQVNVLIYLLNAIQIGRMNESVWSGLPSYTGCPTPETERYVKLISNCIEDLRKKVAAASTNEMTVTVLHEVHLLAMSFLSSKLCLPRFFFQRLQTTDIKLAMSPKGRSPNEAVRIDCNHDCVLKVEGIVRQRWAGPRPVRRIRQAVVNVECVNAGEMSRSECAPVQNDYYKVACLMHFPGPGDYLLNVSVRPVDSKGQSWEFGQREVILIKAEDPSKHQQLHPQRQHQQAAVPTNMQLPRLYKA